MRDSGKSVIWLTRLTYAAHVLTLIALVSAHFTRRAWVRKTMPTHQAQSAAYDGSIGSREENARLGEMDLTRFLALVLSLGIIDGG